MSPSGFGVPDPLRRPLVALRLVAWLEACGLRLVAWLEFFRLRPSLAGDESRSCVDRVA